MKRTLVAAASLFALAACGGSSGGDDGSAEARPSGTPSSLALLSLDKACAQVQMVNEDIGSVGQWAIPTYEKYGLEIAKVAEQSEPDVATALTAMSDQALRVGAMSSDDEGLTEASSEWATRYQEVADMCMRTDSPITRLG